MIIETKKMDEEKLEAEKFERTRSFQICSDSLTDTEIYEFRKKKKIAKKKKKELKLNGDYEYEEITKNKKES